MLKQPFSRVRISDKFFGIPVISLSILLFLTVLQMSAQTHANDSPATPDGWFMAGTKPSNYESGVDSQTVYQRSSSAYLKAKQPNVEGFGTLMQTFSAKQYTGKRVRLSASVKAEEIVDWAGLWMRVDRGSEVVAFDNMGNRPIKGTIDWHDYSVVLDVPSDATGISFGVLLSKSGTVWVNGVKFEIVSQEVPTTNSIKVPAAGPANLSFDH